MTTQDLLQGLSWAADAVRKWAFVTIAIAVAFYVAAFVSGCSHACAVIDAAHTGCMIIRYHDSMGNVREERVDHSDLDRFGQQMALKRTADAGAP